MVVERQLMERQEPNRRDLGREEFVERVWAVEGRIGRTIINQLKRLGASCDWSRERFTMDEGLSRAVLKVFVDLYRAGLIYRDKRLVNWDPKLQTAISDLEVEQVETKGQLWHLRYPLERCASIPRIASTYIVVATTRPETMLGDTAVAVHPEDERYKAPGRQASEPAAGRPPHPHRRRRICRPGEGLGRGEDHAGTRLQRFRGRQAPRDSRRSTSSRRRKTSVLDG